MSFRILRSHCGFSHLNGAAGRENYIVRVGFHDHTILQSHLIVF